MSLSIDCSSDAENAVTVVMYSFALMPAVWYAFCAYCITVLKHISSKNANYGDAEKYLTFEHDEFTMKPTLDADGRLIPRVCW